MRTKRVKAEKKGHRGEDVFVGSMNVRPGNPGTPQALAKVPRTIPAAETGALLHRADPSAVTVRRLASRASVWSCRVPRLRCLDEYRERPRSGVTGRTAGEPAPLFPRLRRRACSRNGPPPRCPGLAGEGSADTRTRRRGSG